MNAETLRKQGHAPASIEPRYGGHPGIAIRPSAGTPWVATESAWIAASGVLQQYRMRPAAGRISRTKKRGSVRSPVSPADLIAATD